MNKTLKMAIIVSVILSIIFIGVISVAQSYKNRDISYACTQVKGMPYSVGWNPTVSCPIDNAIGFPFTFYYVVAGSFGAVLDLPHTVYNIPALIGDFLIFFTVIFSIVYVTFRTRSKDTQSQSY